MTGKKLKYKEYLEKFANCPSPDFKEVDRTAFRWTNNPLSVNDFIPVNLINEPPARMLDELDKMCMAYGLSMFNTFNNSLTKYQIEYKKRRIHQKEQFKRDKGCFIALLNLTMNEGVADLPNENKYGHFTFHEYSETNLEKNVVDLISIFNENGEINI